MSSRLPHFVGLQLEGKVPDGKQTPRFEGMKPLLFLRHGYRTDVPSDLVKSEKGVGGRVFS